MLWSKPCRYWIKPCESKYELAITVACARLEGPRAACTGGCCLWLRSRSVVSLASKSREPKQSPSVFRTWAVYSYFPGLKVSRALPNCEKMSTLNKLETSFVVGSLNGSSNRNGVCRPLDPARMERMLPSGMPLAALKLTVRLCSSLGTSRVSERKTSKAALLKVMRCTAKQSWLPFNSRPFLSSTCSPTGICIRASTSAFKSCTEVHCQTSKMSVSPLSRETATSMVPSVA
mmetsp:Transcript_69358/g.224244  ORF Transcript_69358/g.224244 Transcript_69358/m.224244 type:complete len:232 (-) Transcript_69358:343-1038(-)